MRASVCYAPVLSARHPAGVQVKAGICCAHLESDPASDHGMQEAQQYFTSLLQEPIADTADMCLNVADELLQLGHAEEVCTHCSEPRTEQPAQKLMLPGSQCVV